MSRRVLHAINDRTDPVLLFTDELKTRGFDVVDLHPGRASRFRQRWRGSTASSPAGAWSTPTRRTSIPGWPSRSS